MTHPTHTGHGAAAPDPVAARYYREFAALDADPDVLDNREEQELHGTIAELREELDLAIGERDGALRLVAASNLAVNELQTRHHELVRELTRENARVLGVLARLVAAVMDGRTAPVSEAMDVLEAAGVQVPLAARVLLAVAA